ncbi:hypothetical protein C4K68_20805 [Pokkaliibacter plantistimulans]|uniref:Band 7 domain-containing protein n=1 Tax=Proteobacteria bacterium 228 TaxID=2083153 RepID=A0A2S5KKT2_9PROT|nr:SPFH domain-containing protein [Pokkaliibacter plantistimulans]PPC75408.1 hypothetical protein C4K68_20805 [Pokkaliibacter plantistimulans]
MAATDAHSDLPRYQQAPAQAHYLLLALLGLGCVTLLLWLTAVVMLLLAPASLWLPPLCQLSASLLLLFASLLLAWQRSRQRCAATDQTPLPLPATLHRLLTALLQDPYVSNEATDQEGFRLLPHALRRLLRQPLLHLALLALLSLVLVARGWQLAGLIAAGLAQPAAVPPLLQALSVAVLLLPAAALLVLERDLISRPAADWPEASALAMTVRSVLLVLLLCCLNLPLAAWSPTLWYGLQHLLGLLPVVIAVELLLRVLWQCFQPPLPLAEQRFAAHSLLAHCLDWPPLPMARLEKEIKQTLGVDLQQSWALGYIRQRLLPVSLLMLLCGWLLSGLHSLSLDQRGVYERLGQPVAVLQPGLHLLLPWPLGKLITVDNGSVHELGAMISSQPPGSISSADGAAPARANRLWDAAHDGEKTQLIASGHDQQQSFQVMDMDIRFLYQIGASDADALASVYHCLDLPQLVRNSANQVLIQEFAYRTLDDVLGLQRSQLDQYISRAMQRQLDAMSCGVHIVATELEAIHPPAGAAAAYHAVQAAQINAQSLIALAEGHKAELLNLARTEAGSITDQASAQAHEGVAQANADSIGFSAEKQANDSAPHTFVQERYLHQLASALPNAQQVLIIDSRISAAHTPMIDLRNLTPELSAGFGSEAPASHSTSGPADTSTTTTDSTDTSSDSGDDSSGDTSP